MKPHLDTTTATLESNLVRDLGIDSLSMLLMSLALEKKFNVNFDTTRAPFTTVGEVVGYIKENQK